MVDSADPAVRAGDSPPRILRDGDEPVDRLAGLHFHLYSGPPSGGVRWRLLGGNNRELGRGALVYADAHTCRAGLERTIAELAAYDAAVVRIDRSRWGWRLRQDGLDVVGSGHAFDRRPRCEEACLRFLRLAPIAPVRDSLTVMPWTGRSMRPSVLHHVGGPDDHRWPDVHPDSPGRPSGFDVLPPPRRGGVSLQGLPEGWREQSR